MEAVAGLRLTGTLHRVTDPKVDAYFARSTQWPEELAAIRPLLLEAGLDEAFKWGKPCYTHDGANILILQEMKAHLAVMFFKGALLSDPAGVLRSQGPNSRSALRIEITSTEEVHDLADLLRDYVAEAIEVEASGLEVAPAPELELVEELRLRLEADPALRAAFESLTPGRQREYHLHISEAKQAATRESRVDKAAPRILAGKGLRDR